MNMQNSELCTDRILSEDYLDFISEINTMLLKEEVLTSQGCLVGVNQFIANVYFSRDSLIDPEVKAVLYNALTKCYSLLDLESLDASGILAVQEQPVLGLRGQGVLIGFVDTGIDYQNEIFRKADGTTRIEAIWDQTIQTGHQPDGFYYGSEYRKSEIDDALKSKEPLKIVPSVDNIGHGTGVASVAAGGRDIEHKFIGAAPECGIVCVKLKEAKQYLRDFYFIKESAIVYQETDILLGIRYLMEIADILKRPIVTCIALGTNFGDHNGNSHLSKYLSQIATLPTKAVVVAGGNEANLGHHYYGRLEPSMDSVEVELRAAENERGFVLELWGNAPDLFSVSIRSPGGEMIPRIPVRTGQSDVYNFIFEETIIYIDYFTVETASGDQLILMRFDRPTAGIWYIRVFGNNIINGTFNMWLPSEGFISSDTYFLRSNPDITLTNPANAIRPISVSTYNGANNSIWLNSSRGYTRAGYIKPDFAAPGVQVTSGLPGNKFRSQSGSSMAAAITAGAAAQMMEWGVVRKNAPYMDSQMIKSYFIRGAEKDQGIMYPNREWGYGRLNILNTFENLRIT